MVIPYSLKSFLQNNCTSLSFFNPKYFLEQGSATSVKLRSISLCTVEIFTINLLARKTVFYRIRLITQEFGSPTILTAFYSQGTVYIIKTCSPDGVDKNNMGRGRGRRRGKGRGRITTTTYR